MNYKDQEYEQFMRNVVGGKYQVLEVSLSEWESIHTRTTLKSTNGEERYDSLHSNDIEHIYQVVIALRELNYDYKLSECINFDENRTEAEKAYEELLKRRVKNETTYEMRAHSKCD